MDNSPQWNHYTASFRTHTRATSVKDALMNLKQTTKHIWHCKDSAQAYKDIIAQLKMKVSELLNDKKGVIRCNIEFMNWWNKGGNEEQTYVPLQVFI